MGNSIDRRNRRREAWMNLDAKLQYRIDTDKYSYMSGEIAKYATQQWAKERITHFDAETKDQLPDWQIQVIKILAAIIGAVTFASVPIVIAQQTQKGSIVTIAGGVGGAVAGFGAHACVCRILVSNRLRQSYNKAKETINVM